MDDLLQEFIAETRETLEALSGEIIAWEAAPADRARLDAIFRFVHTVKGSCGFLDLPRLLRLSHAAEDVLAEVRDGKRTPDCTLVNAVLAVVDRIGELVEAIDAGASLDDNGEELLIAALAEGAEAELPAAVVPTGPTRSGGGRSVRLNVDLLDRMMSGMSDMVLARNELARRMRDVDLEPGVEAALERLSTTVADMRDTVTRTRMQKIETLFSALPRIVRDTASAVGRSVALQLEGSDVELDREMIEVMRDPLVHLVRNAIDHGIETPADRRAAGKPEQGRLHIAARQSGNQIIVEIVDDGRGIDTDRLIRKLVAGGRDEGALRALSDRARAELVFEPGLSSRDTVSEISGRGVGMDVVRAAIDQIGGRIELDNEPGRGLRVAVQVPLTLSIISTIVVSAGGHRFAIPRQAIGEIVSEGNASVRRHRVAGAAVVAIRDQRMPEIALADLLGLADTAADGDRMLVIVGIGAVSYALAVDAVLDSEELVVKPAAPAVMATGVYAGQTLPDNGRPMLLLDCAGIAAVGRLDFERCAVVVDEDEVEVEATELPALLFVGCDGVRRAMPLAAIDRIERVPAAAVQTAAGCRRLSLDGKIVAVEAVGGIDARDELTILRLTDGADVIAYAIGDAIDIVSLPPAMAPAILPGPIAGVVLLGGVQVELVDAHWLFAEAACGTPPSDARPLCVLAGPAGGWIATFLRPIVEQAGYRVALTVPANERPAAVLAEAGDHPVDSGGAPVIRLRATAAAGRGDDSIYRYDRGALVAALATAGKAR